MTQAGWFILDPVAMIVPTVIWATTEYHNGDRWRTEP